MKIAIIAWGSLLWDQRDLSIRNGWHADGPLLPVEFARISNGPRLTLVLVPNVREIPTYWAESAHDVLENAIQNLAEREKCPIGRIGVTVKGKSSSTSVNLPIEGWLQTTPSVDAAIWTNLTSNFEEVSRQRFSPDAAVAYLRSLLLRNEHQAAEEYIRRAPRQTDTAVRQEARRVFNWTDLC